MIPHPSAPARSFPTVRRLGLTVPLLFALCLTAAPDRPVAGQEPGLTLEELRAGGYVIFFRHVTAAEGSDAAVVDVNNCDTQRNIGHEGLRDARAIGQAFRLLAIPVGTVSSSEYCRALETAQIAFGRAERVPALNLCCADAVPMTNEERLTYIVRAVALPPPRGMNTVIVGHGVGIMVDLAMGEAAIYRPDGRGGAERVARVLPAEWMAGVYPPGGPR